MLTLVIFSIFVKDRIVDGWGDAQTAGLKTDKPAHFRKVLVLVAEEVFDHEGQI